MAQVCLIRFVDYSGDDLFAEPSFHLSYQVLCWKSKLVAANRCGRDLVRKASQLKSMLWRRLSSLLCWWDRPLFRAALVDQCFRSVQHPPTKHKQNTRQRRDMWLYFVLIHSPKHRNIHHQRGSLHPVFCVRKLMHANHAKLHNWLPSTKRVEMFRFYCWA